MGVDERELRGVAERIAVEAAELVAGARERMLGGERVEVGTKSADTDVVTAVDRESERLIRDRLTGERPGDAVLGEEEGGEEDSEASSSAVTWVVDPIDGTVNFLYGYPWFAVSIAARVDGVSVAGAVVEPVSGRRWTAARGHGATLDGRPLRCSAPSRLELALVATGFAYVAERRARQAAFTGELLGHVRDLRRAGAASLDLCAVAAGWVDGYFEHGLSPWDWGAGALIAEEAGAVVRLPGQDPELGADAVFAAAPSIAAELRDTAIRCGIGQV